MLVDAGGGHEHEPVTFLAWASIAPLRTPGATAGAARRRIGRVGGCMLLFVGGRVAAEERGTSWPVLGSTVCSCVLCFLGGGGTVTKHTLLCCVTHKSRQLNKRPPAYAPSRPRPLALPAATRGARERGQPGRAAPHRASAGRPAAQAAGGGRARGGARGLVVVGAEGRRRRRRQQRPGTVRRAETPRRATSATPAQAPARARPPPGVL